MKTFDIIVLGAGNAMDVPRIAGPAGKRVALIEKSALGGTCPNRGCIPSKLLIAHAEVANTIRDAGRFHIKANIESIDADQVLRDVKSYTDRFDNLLEDGLPENVTLFRGHGRFVDPHTVEVNGEQLTAPMIVIATGSRPRRPEGIEAPYWTSDEVFAIESAPRSLTIVGGGYIATELATFFQGVGVQTTVLARDNRLLGLEDEELQPIIRKGFTRRVDVRFKTSLISARQDGDSVVMTLKDTDGNETEHRSERLLYAIGRVPNADTIGLEHTGVTLNDRGYIAVDDNLRTNVAGIFAMGDVTGRHMFTHAASLEAKYLGRQLIGESDAPLDYGPMPHAVFADPEVAGVGRTEQELRRDGVAFKKGVVTYDAATKGRAIKEEHGLVKILVALDGTILGAHIVGAHASILLHEIIPVMKWKNHISSLTEIIHIHPSLPEVVRGAARKAQEALD